MNAESTAVFDRILSAVLNGTVQGVLLAWTLWLSFRVLPRTNAATRHALGLAFVVLAALLPMAHFFRPKPGATEVPPTQVTSALFPTEKENLPANIQPEAVPEKVPQVTRRGDSFDETPSSGQRAGVESRGGEESY